MKRTTAFLCIIAMMLTLWATCAVAQDVRVKGYDRQDGTHVDSYMRTAPDSTRDNNYSTRGNTNPYTGEAGHKAPDSSYSQPRTDPYGSSNPFGNNPYGGSSHGKRGY